MTRIHVDLTDGLKRTYDVTRYVIEEGVLRLYDSDGHGTEEEIAAFAQGGWLRVERDRPPV